MGGRGKPGEPADGDQPKRARSEFLVRGLFSRAANPVIHVKALQDLTLRVG